VRARRLAERRGPRRRGPRRALVAALAALFLLAAASPAPAAFPQDPPNDPAYDPAGPQAPCADGRQFHLFSFIPSCAVAASDPEGAAGMSVDRAWREFSTGSPQTTIAYIEAGINWRGNDIEDLVNKVFVNAGELPAPTTPAAGDAACPGALCAAHFGDTADANGNGVVDPEDLIVRFSDGTDADANGFPDDISGWDFYSDTNNPATGDSAYEHANNQMKQAAAETDNGVGRAGVCPDCRLLPVKAGAEALDRTDDLAQAWLYAARIGSGVVVSVTADLGYSTFARRAAESLHRRGVSLVVASNDFNSTDHQGGMFHPHAIPGNGVVADAAGLEQASIATTTFRERSGITSWGTHNVLSVPTQGGTTSASTPTLGGVIGLVMGYSREAAAEGKITRPLTGPETVQVLRETASDVNDPGLAWPNRAGWDLQFGYGRPNAHRAMEAISQGRVPPLAAIDSPDWFELHDPTRTARIPVRGRIDAGRSGGYTYTLEMGVGPEPADDQFVAIGSGTGGSQPFEGALGEADLASVPREVWARAFALSERKELETSELYTVTLRLRVRDSAGRLGEDRRSIFVHRDSTAVEGFPLRIGPGGESQPALADLQGLGRLAIVFADTDGAVHAVDPSTRKELEGWPVRTDPTRVQAADAGVPPGHEPIVSNVAVGDLEGTGRLSVVASTTTGKLYVWDERGRRRAGFPQALATGVAPPPTPRPDDEYARQPAQGSFAAPVLGDLDDDGVLEIVQAAWDGRLHVFRPDGSEKPGWPVKVELPPGDEPAAGQLRIDDEKLQGTPALADLDGEGRLEIVQRSQFTDVAEASPDPSPTARGHLHAYRSDGTPVPGWPVDMIGVTEAYGTAQEFITEGTNSPVAADVDGDGDDEVASNPVFSQSYLFDGDGGDPIRVYGPLPDATAGLLNGTNVDPAQIAAGNLPADVPVGFTTTGAFGRFAGGLSFVQPGSGAATIAATILAPGLGNPIKNFERAFDATTGAPRPNFPAQTQGLNFVGAPLVVDVDGDGAAEVVDGGDSSALHGFGADGRQVEGFPKFTSGWTLWSPAAGDLDGDGTTEVVTTTREGYLFAWHTKGRAEANDQWWRWHHDEHSSGRYGADTRPPGAVRGLRSGEDGRSVSLVLPGDDWYTGRAKELRVTAVPRATATRGSARARRAQAPPARSVAVSGAAGETQAVPVAAGTARVSVQGVDDAGNLGREASVEIARAPAPAAEQERTDRPVRDRDRTPERDRANAGDDDGDLPFTGLALLALALAGLLLLAAGLALRRRARTEPDRP